MRGRATAGSVLDLCVATILFLLVSGGPFAGCSRTEETASGGARPRVPMPATAAASQAGRRKLELPPPIPPPPKPDGQPQRPEDFRKLAEAAGVGAPVLRPGAPPIVRLDEQRLKIGETLVDKAARRVEVPARVNMTEGILEYYACAPTGKLHESVLETLDKGSHLHLALLLLGLEPSEYVQDERIGPRVVREGSRVRVFVEWKDAKGAPQRKPAEAWLYNRRRKSSPSGANWTFLGSQFWNGEYSADTGKSIVGLIPDPTVVVGIVGNEGNPYQGMEGFEVFTKTIPPKGTPVSLVFEPAGT